RDERRQNMKKKAQPIPLKQRSFKEKKGYFYHNSAQFPQGTKNPVRLTEQFNLRANELGCKFKDKGFECSEGIISISKVDYEIWRKELNPRQQNSATKDSIKKKKGKRILPEKRIFELTVDGLYYHYPSYIDGASEKIQSICHSLNAVAKKK